MPHFPIDSISSRLLRIQSDSRRASFRSRFAVVGLLGLCAALLSIALPGASLAQNWEGEPSGNGPSSNWSLRTGIGFTADPTTFLLNFEAPYAFDRWVSVGPKFQVGLDKDNTVLAPTVNVNLTIPDLPGESFDRLHPYLFTGIGFAYLENDNRRHDDSDAGFLINFGFGLEYQVRENVFLGSEMIFNFLPKKTVGEHFFYAWQIGGVRFAF